MLLAFAAILVAAKEARRNSSARNADRRVRLFEKIVVDPLLPAVGAYCEDVRSILRSAGSDVAGLVANNTGHREVVDLVKNCVDRFNQRHSQLFIEIETRLTAWPDRAQLAADLLQDIRDLEDVVVLSMESLASAKQIAIAPGEIERRTADFTAKLLRELERLGAPIPEKGWLAWLFPGN